METLEETLTPLNRGEARRVAQIARRRDAELWRGRAEFSCTFTDGIAGDDEFHRASPECARVALHWEDGLVWQARAWDQNGRLLSDTASDGKWVEADGKRWHINYLADRGWEERSADIETTERWTALGDELESRLWCLGLCSNHLFLDNVLFESSPFGRDLYRDTVRGDIVYRMHQRGSRLHAGPWDRLRWLVARIAGRKVTLEEITGRPMELAASDCRLFFDGEHLHPIRAEGWVSETEYHPGCERTEVWQDHIAIARGFQVARLYESHSGFSEPALLYRTELIAEKSALGDGATVEIRPVDYALPTVDR